MQSSRLRFVSLFSVITTGSDVSSKVNDEPLIGVTSFDIQT